MWVYRIGQNTDPKQPSWVHAICLYRSFADYLCKRLNEHVPVPNPPMTVKRISITVEEVKKLYGESVYKELLKQRRLMAAYRRSMYEV